MDEPYGDKPFQDGLFGDGEAEEFDGVAYEQGPTVAGSGGRTRLRRFLTAIGYGMAPTPDEETMAARARGWTSRTIVVATLLLAVFNARSLQTWAATLDPNWGGETARSLADAWAGRMQAAGLDAPRAAIHDAYAAKKAVTWSDLGAAPPLPSPPP